MTTGRSVRGSGGGTRAERESGQRDMGYLMVAEPSAEYDTLGSRIRWIDESPDDTLGEVAGEGGAVSAAGGFSGEYRAPAVGCGRVVRGGLFSPKGAGTGRDPGAVHYDGYAARAGGGPRGAGARAAPGGPAAGSGVPVLPLASGVSGSVRGRGCRRFRLRAGESAVGAR